MNKAYRLMGNKAKERWVIEAEIIEGKVGAAFTGVAALVACVSLSLSATGAHALPSGGQVSSGQATISALSNSQLNISQGTSQAIINWNSFGIGKGEAVCIDRPGHRESLRWGTGWGKSRSGLWQLCNRLRGRRLQYRRTGGEQCRHGKLQLRQGWGARVTGDRRAGGVEQRVPRLQLRRGQCDGGRLFRRAGGL